MLGNHTIKTWSSTQSIISLSSGEAEFYGIVKGGTVTMGIQSLLSEIGFHTQIIIKSDASAAIGIVKRKGLGQVRHIDVHDIWIQEKVSSGKFIIHKVHTYDNLADALTKYVDPGKIIQHVTGTKQKWRVNESSMALKV